MLLDTRKPKNKVINKIGTKIDFKINPEFKIGFDLSEFFHTIDNDIIPKAIDGIETVIMTLYPGQCMILKRTLIANKYPPSPAKIRASLFLLTPNPLKTATRIANGKKINKAIVNRNPEPGQCIILKRAPLPNVQSPKLVIRFNNQKPFLSLISKIN